MAEESEYYKYALTQSYYEPNIYNDEEKQEQENGDVRLIISRLIESSKGDMRRLQAYMCLMAGMTLREVGHQCHTSHEIIRIWREKIRYSYPDLYHIMRTQKNKVKSLVPECKSKKWMILNIETQKLQYYDTLKEWSTEQDLNYETVKKAVQRKKIIGKYQIFKL